MKHLKTIFYILFFAFIVYELTPLYNTLFNKNSGKSFSSSALEDTKVSVSYILEQNRTITFSIPTGAKTLRILSNIDIPKAKIDRELPFGYSIFYEVLDGNDKAIVSKTYHHYTRVVKFIDPVTKEKITTRFYINEDLTPSSTRKFFIHLKGLKDPKKIRFSLSSLDKDAKGATLRSYYQITNPEHQLTDMWRRLGSKTKESLARGNVYESELLTWSERRNLLSKSWRPFGPLGVRGKDYELNNIYTKTGLDDLEEIPLVFGRLLEPPKRFTYKLEEGKSYTIESSFDIKKTEVFVNHYDSNGSLKEYSYLQGKDNKEVGAFQGGVLEVFANESLFVNVYDDSNEELAPSRRYKYSLLLDKDITAKFKINHLKNYATPLRLSYRFVGENRDAKLFVNIGKKRFTLQTDPEISFYDSHTDRDLAKSVGKEDVRYFRIPKGVKNITLEADAPLLVNVAVAVPTRPSTTIIGLKDVKAPPTWYTIQPTNSVKDLWSFKGIVPKVKELNPKFSHKELEVTSSSWSRAVLIRKNAEVPIKFYQYPSVFIPINNNQKIYGEFKTPEGVESTSSSLIYKREKASSSFISVYVDNGLILHERISNKESVVRLPKLKKRGKTLEIKSSEESKFWVSGFLEEGKRDLFMRRYLYNLEKPISFQVVKESREPLTLSFKLYRKVDTQKTTLRAKLKKFNSNPLAPFERLTLQERVYEIYKNEEKEQFTVLGTDIEVVEERTIFFTLGDDLKSGVYSVQFTKEDNSLGYLYGYIGVEDYKDDFYLFKESL